MFYIIPKITITNKGNKSKLNLLITKYLKTKLDANQFKIFSSFFINQLFNF